MTLKQKRLLENIPTSKSLKEAALKAGYSEYTADSKIHSLVRNSKGLKNIFDEGYIRSEIKKAQREARKAEDRSNNIRALELMSRIEGMQRDKVDYTHNVSEEEKINLNRLASRLAISN